MKRTLILALIVVTLAALSGAVAAQENSTATDAGAQSTYVGCIDERTCVVDYGYANGTMHVTLESSSYQRIALSDTFGGVDTSGGFAGGSEQKRVTLTAGRTEVTMGVEEYEGLVGVDVGTSRGGATLTTKTAAIIFHRSASWSDVQAVSIFVALGGFWIAFVVANYLTANRGPSAERVN